MVEFLTIVPVCLQLATAPAILDGRQPPPHAHPCLARHLRGGPLLQAFRIASRHDMAVFNLRDEQPIGNGPFSVGGEIAVEFAGRCRRAGYCTAIGQPMRERAGHVEAGYRVREQGARLLAEAGYVYYSRDFTPLMPGFSE